MCAVKLVRGIELPNCSKYGRCRINLLAKDSLQRSAGLGPKPKHTTRKLYVICKNAATLGPTNEVALQSGGDLVSKWQGEQQCTSKPIRRLSFSARGTHQNTSKATRGLRAPNPDGHAYFCDQSTHNLKCWPSAVLAADLCASTTWSSVLCQASLYSKGCLSNPLS